MIRALLLLAAVVVVVVAARAWLAGGRRVEVDRTARGGRAEDLVQDPVCLTFVPRSRAVAARGEAGPPRFCSVACAERHLEGRRA